MLERVRIQAGSDRMLRCYRLSMPLVAPAGAAVPGSAEPSEPSERIDAAAEGSTAGPTGPVAAETAMTPLQCEGRIIPLGRGRPIPGVLEELSPDTARIRCSLTAALIRGAAVDFEADLPEPMGRLRTEGEILTVTAPAPAPHGWSGGHAAIRHTPGRGPSGDLASDRRRIGGLSPPDTRRSRAPLEQLVSPTSAIRLLARRGGPAAIDCGPEPARIPSRAA